MISVELQEQITEVLQKYKNLKQQSYLNCNTIITGILGFNIHENGNHVRDHYDLCIEVPQDYPKKLPKVIEIGTRIPKEFHTNPDGALCLGTEASIYVALTNNSALIEFVEQILIKYLFSFSLWEKNGSLPFGERSHGPKGIMEFFLDLFQVCEYSKVQEILRYLAKGKPYSRNKKCPCRSNRRIRNCHGKQIILLKGSYGLDKIRKDYLEIKYL